MTEEEREEQEEGQVAEEEPEVYAVKKDMNGWQFNRRTFLAAAGATAAAAAVGSVASCSPAADGPGEGARTVVVVVTATPSPVTEAIETPVPEASPTATATETPVPTDTALPTKTPTATLPPTPAVPKAKFIKDVTVPDGTVMKPGQAFTKTWRFQNVGAVPWGEGVKLVFVEGQQKGFESKKMAGPDSVDVPNVAPGKSVDVSVNLVAPEKLGKYRSYWRLKLGSGAWLENNHYAEIFVASPEPVDKSVEPGKKGIEFKVKIEGKWVTWTQPCGMPIPPGAVCVCNCVSVSAPCSCDGVCSCVGHTTCTCDTVHYWYPT